MCEILYGSGYGSVSIIQIISLQNTDCRAMFLVHQSNVFPTEILFLDSCLGTLKNPISHVQYGISVTPAVL